ncbi:EAL domain-containing protein [Piscinibacter sp. HJYY11]|uniref:EAL domain-containing protein n=1 Tax=Piscinibacter sp. HJYY11 TaxID=2801333 RepID=UPI00192020E5|nr:EAL domain-containing protein [Piscinibacter sp. HJYY11]MBL0729945.1 EAL domain-containing protein [Piscinibacter sp. HJYY11]
MYRHVLIRWRAIPAITRLYVTAASVAGALLAALGGGTWWMLERAYTTSVQLAYSEVDSASQRLSDRVQRLFDQLNQTASLVKHYQENNGGADLVMMEKSGLLIPAGRLSMALADQMGQVLGMTEAQGAVPAKAKHVADRQHFQGSWTRTDLAIAQPVYSDELKRWLVPGGKQLQHPNGKFAGAVLLAFDAALLTEGFVVNDSPGNAVGVVGSDGIFRSRLADERQSAGDQVDGEQIVRAVNRADRAMVPSASSIDGIVRFRSVTPIPGHDLYAVVAVPASTSMAGYYALRTKTLATAAAGALLILFMTVVLSRQSMRLRRTVIQKEAAELRVYHEKEMLEVTLRSIVDGVATTNYLGRITYLNPAAEAMTGWPAAQAIGKPVSEVICLTHAHTRERLGLGLNEFARPGAQPRPPRDSVLVQRDGAHRSIEDSAAPILNRNGQAVGAVLVLHDVSPAKKLAAEMSYQASHDLLTGLVNRAAFEVRLDAAITTQDLDDTGVVMFLDLDQFKVVNDTCGHVAGDQLLKQVTALLMQEIRKQDTLARLGGDEFAVLLEACPLEPALRVAEAMRRRISELQFSWEGRSFQLTVSVGVVPFKAHQYTRSDLLRVADSSCYVAKEAGRNRVHVYDEADTAVATRNDELDWYSRLQKALTHDRFVLYAQRIASIQEDAGGYESVEVLIRLRDDEGKIVAPIAFIPAAERYGLMPQIDRWVISKALEMHADFARHYTLPARFSINLSGASMADPTLVDFVRQELKKHRVSPELICFEITETAAVASFDVAVQMINGLRELGCRFALDDFGAGMSSFTYLKRLPVDYVKIDGAFVKDMAKDAVDFAMVEAIHNIAHRMGLRTVAEFVQNDVTIELLRGLGVDYVQGYGVEKPRPLDDDTRSGPSPSFVAPKAAPKLMAA